MSVLVCPISANAQGTASCYINDAGDYVCPLGADPGSGNNPFLNNDAGNSTDVFSAGSPLFTGINDVSGVTSGLLGQIMSLYDDLSGSLKDVLLDELINLLIDDADAADFLNLVNDITSLNSDLTSLDGLLCPGGGSVSNDLVSYAQNNVALNFSLSDGAFNIDSLTSSLCEDSSSGSSPTIGGEGGERIAQSAEASINNTTADHPDTQGGNVGCAVAVTRILRDAGYDIGILPGTATLHSTLSSDPCFEEVITGSITGDDALNLQRGDVLVTARNASTGKAGHTGIYVGNGEIISNSSSGFAGSEPGTIQKNYNVDKWNSGVITRNPSVSSVFRRICP